MNSTYTQDGLRRAQSVYIGYGLRELDASEYNTECIINLNKPISVDLKKSTKFTEDFGLTTFSSGCFYINPQTFEWSNYGVDVLSDTNLTHVHCTSNHLTEFAGGFIVIPPAIDFDYVFANSSFLQNPTIYATIIFIVGLYLNLVVICRIFDIRDFKKSKIHLLEDNNPIDGYFYELIIYTGSRKNSSTQSNVTKPY